MWTYLIVLDTAEEDEAKLNLVLLEGGQRDLFTSALGGGSLRWWCLIGHCCCGIVLCCCVVWAQRTIYGDGGANF